MGRNDLGHDQSDYCWNTFSFYIKKDMESWSNFLSKWELVICNNVVLLSVIILFLIGKYN